jgi:hypothetical protein
MAVSEPNRPCTEIQGFPRWQRKRDARERQRIATFLLHHRHGAAECRAAFAAWKGFDSPLRRRPTLGSCASGGHELFWQVDATDAAAALAQLPPYLASRTQALEVAEVAIP